MDFETLLGLRVAGPATDASGAAIEVVFLVFDVSTTIRPSSVILSVAFLSEVLVTVVSRDSESSALLMDAAFRLSALVRRFWFRWDVVCGGRLRLGISLLALSAEAEGCCSIAWMPVVVGIWPCAYRTELVGAASESSSEDQPDTLTEVSIMTGLRAEASDLFCLACRSNSLTGVLLEYVDEEDDVWSGTKMVVVVAWNFTAYSPRLHVRVTYCQK